MKDHHPEWHTDNGGKNVHVRLTSHFANNQVTLLDFELAEHMNQEFSKTQRFFNMYPRITERMWSSLSIGVGTFVLFFSIYNYVTAETYGRTDAQRGQPLPRKLPANYGRTG